MAQPSTPSDSQAVGTIPEIDGLRGFAILFVMIHRLWPRDPSGATAAFPEAGWVGVDLFFVVSGFLITRILLATRDDPDYFRNFYARRVLRIFPLYYLFVGTLLVVFPLLGSAAYLHHAGSPAWYALFLGNVPEGVLGRDPPYWLAPVWSLAIEEQFYLTFPALVRWCRDRDRLASVLFALLVLAPIARAVAYVMWPGRDRLPYLFTPCRVDAIAAGCAMAIVVQAPWFQRARRRFAGAALLALAIGCATGLDRTTVWGRIGGYSVVAFGFAGLLGWVLAARNSRATAVLRMPALRYVGKLCFGLYLLHRPADTAVCAVAARLGLDATVGVIWVPVKIAVAIAFATVSWQLLERRVLRLKRWFVSSAHPLAARAGASAPTLARGVATVAIVASLVACSPRSPSGDTDDARMPATDAGAADADRPSDGTHPANDAGSDALGVPGSVVLYTFDRTHSPITPAVMTGLQAIAARAPASQAPVFAKIGDSITALPAFMTCFDGGPDALGSNTDLSDTLAYYENTDAAGSSSYARDSEAATGNWTAADLLTGSPCPVDSEIAAIAPRVALLMIGTNDNREGVTLPTYGANLWTVVDKLIGDGVVPLMWTIPPVQSDPYSNPRVPVFGLVDRAIAQGRQVPLVDFYQQMVSLPNEGLGSDGLHPSIAPDGACMLTASDLASYGFNVRNLLALQQLDRVRGALAGTAPDVTAPTRQGTGQLVSPFAATLPLADLDDTNGGDPAMTGYPAACASGSGHQRVYAVTLGSAATVDAYAITHDQVGMTVDILSGALSASACVAGGQGEATASLPAGTSYVVVTGTTAASDGEYILAVQGQ